MPRAKALKLWHHRARVLRNLRLWGVQESNQSGNTEADSLADELLQLSIIKRELTKLAEGFPRRLHRKCLVQTEATVHAIEYSFAGRAPTDPCTPRAV